MKPSLTSRLAALALAASPLFALGTAAAAGPTLTPAPSSAAAAKGSTELPPGVQEIRGKVIQEGPAERAQPVLLEESGRRWSLACVPPMIWNRVVGEDVIVTGIVQQGGPDLLRPTPLCVRKIDVPPKAGESKK